MISNCVTTGSKGIYSRYLQFLLMFLVIAIVWGCANIVSPTGGPRDTTPPEVVAADPPSGSVNFETKSFTLTFSEFIQLGNLQQQILISPPLKDPPKFRLRSKNLIVSFSDTLLPNTTYSFFFGDAIKDITENNLMAAYSYYLATGPVIDSLTLNGTVMNAWNQKIEEGIFVMLYEASAPDSAFAREKPRYVTRPDKSGAFSFKHLSGGEYHLVAVADLNNNMLYDLPTEPVAFYPETVSPTFIAPRVSITDTTAFDADTLAVEIIADTMAADTIAVITPDSVVHISGVPDVKRYQLKMFIGEDSIQRVLTARSDGRYKVFVAMRYPTVEPKIHIVDSLLRDVSRFTWNSRKDTLQLWLRQHTRDSVVFILDDLAWTDTIIIALRALPETSRGRPVVPKVLFTMNVPRNGKLHPAAEPVINFNMPLVELNTEGALLLSPNDTVPLKLLPADTTLMIKFLLDNKLHPDTQYTVLLPEGACAGWDGSSNDTLLWPFTIDIAENYGTLTVLITIDTPATGNTLLMLMDENSAVVETRNVQNESVQTFPQIKPGKYTLRAVADLNGNGRWDTGDYWKRIQPEPVSVMPAPIDIRANWEEEIEWHIRF